MSALDEMLKESLVTLPEISVDPSGTFSINDAPKEDEKYVPEEETPTADPKEVLIYSYAC